MTKRIMLHQIANRQEAERVVRLLRGVKGNNFDFQCQEGLVFADHGISDDAMAMELLVIYMFEAIVASR